jgi:two-component system, OmpR family, response regulator ResD
MVVAGDEMWGVEKIRLALSSAGYKVIAIENWEAIDIMSWNKPALIIASLTADRTENISLCKLFVRYGDAPVIVISSPEEEYQQLGFFETGITDFLTYPVNPRELVARVNNILNRTQPPLLRNGTAGMVGSDSFTSIAQNERSLFSKMIRGITKRFTRLPHL